MTENETRTEHLAVVAYKAFGAFIAGGNVAFGCGLPFDALPPEVQTGFRDSAVAVLGTVAPQDEAPATVTVTTDSGEHRYSAADYALDVRGLHVLAEKNADSSAFAFFPDGHFTRAEIDGHRVPCGPDHSARAAGLEAELRAVLDIVEGCDTIGPTSPLAAIRDRVSRALANATAAGR